MQLTFIVNWEKQLSRNLRIFAVNIWNLQPFFKDSVDIVHERSNSIFKSSWSNVEKSPTWKPLSQSTLKARSSRKGYYRQSPSSPWVLRWTWKLQDNISKSFTKTSWKLEYLQPYAKYHQNWWKKLPKRAIIDLSNSTNALIIKALQKKINDDIWIFWRQV